MATISAQELAPLKGVATAVRLHPGATRLADQVAETETALDQAVERRALHEAAQHRVEEAGDVAAPLGVVYGAQEAGPQGDLHL